jgi:hypothetical protein
MTKTFAGRVNSLDDPHSPILEFYLINSLSFELPEINI